MIVYPRTICKDRDWTVQRSSSGEGFVEWRGKSAAVPFSMSPEDMFVHAHEQAHLKHSADWEDWRPKLERWLAGLGVNGLGRELVVNWTEDTIIHDRARRAFIGTTVPERILAQFAPYDPIKHYGVSAAMWEWTRRCFAIILYPLRDYVQKCRKPIKTFCDFRTQQDIDNALQYETDALRLRARIAVVMLQTAPTEIFDERRAINCDAPYGKDEMERNIAPVLIDGIPWCEMKMHRCNLDRNATCLSRARRTIPRYTGSKLGKHARLVAASRHLAAVPGFKHIGLTKGSDIAVVIDASGSMSLTATDILSFLEIAPKATIAYYHSNCIKTGRLVIVADKGRYASNIDWVFNAGNGVDGPALRWLGRQRARIKLWCCDGLVTGEMDSVSDALTAECTILCKRYGIARVNDLASLQAALKTFVK